MVELLPGDAATAYLGRNATPERLAHVRNELGLDRPAVERYLSWMAGILNGDFGSSLSRREPIADLIWIRLRNSLFVGLTAAVILVPLVLFLGVVAGLTSERWPDVVLSVASLVSMSMPDFVVGTLLIYIFSLKLSILPAITVVDANAPIVDLLPYIVLPVTAIILTASGYLLRIMRTSIIDALRTNHVQMAHLKGVPALRVVIWHALPGALFPFINASALSVAWMICGLVVIETVFNYPGIGTLTLNAIQTRDLPLVQAIVLVLAGCYLLTNLLADLLMLLLNPKLRTFNKR